MKLEIESAVDFVSNILKGRVEDGRVNTFRNTLLESLNVHYENHWFPEKPFRGSAYRCIRINHKMDPLIGKAGVQCGLTEEVLFAILPNELTLWVDPEEVSYRIGEDGSIGVLFGNDGSSSDSDSSMSSSPTSSPFQLEDTPPMADVFQNSCKNQFRTVDSFLSSQQSPSRSATIEYLTANS